MSQYPELKKVNIFPQRPITTVNPPVRSVIRGVYMSIEDIRRCLVGRGIVEEVFSDNSTIKLDFSNFDKDNTVSAKDKDLAEANKKAAEAAAAAKKAEEERLAKEAEAKRAEEKARKEAEEKAKAEAEAAKKAAEEAAAVKTADIEAAAEEKAPEKPVEQQNNKHDNNGKK